jgi:hypothetical protein
MLTLTAIQLLYQHTLKPLCGPSHAASSPVRVLGHLLACSVAATVAGAVAADRLLAVKACFSPAGVRPGSQPDITADTHRQCLCKYHDLCRFKDGHPLNRHRRMHQALKPAGRGCKLVGCKVSCECSARRLN